VREMNGLAMSSRNRYLDAAERHQAPALRRALLSAKAEFAKGETRASKLHAIAALILAKEAPLGRVDYLEVVSKDSLQTVAAADATSLIALAVFFGRARLIDNLELG
jgi:pantoate--beta-alanine ligase